MTRNHASIGVVLCLAAMAGCQDSKASSTKAAPSIPTIEVGAPAPRERKAREPVMTDEDREVIAYLAAWDPATRQLHADAAAAHDRTREVRIARARRREADAAPVCAELAALREKGRTWLDAHPLPAPLADSRVQAYVNKLSFRRTTDQEVVGELAQRVRNHLDQRRSFARRFVRDVEEDARDLQCEPPPAAAQ